MDNTIIGNSFDQIEKIFAGYIMNTTDLGRFRLVLGLRFENTGEDNLGYNGESNPNRGVGSTPIRVQYSYLDVLSSGSLRYALTPTQGVRVVYGRGLARPQFSDLIPFQTVTSSGSARTTVSRGNPGIRAEYADNIDVLYENNLPRTGMLQAGFFYKNLSKPILPTQTLVAPDPVLTGNNLPYYLNQTVNAGSAYIYGLEVSSQQHLTNLPGLLRYSGISANYGYTASQAKFPAYIDPAVLQPGQISGPNRGPEGANPALIGQAPNSFNLSPTYDRGGLSVRLGATYNQALGVRMGDPAFKIRDLIKRENITLFSSNYAYYGDVSHRVVQTLAPYFRPSRRVPSMKVFWTRVSSAKGKWSLLRASCAIAFIAGWASPRALASPPQRPSPR